MELPSLTPKDLTGLENSQDDKELFSKLSYDYESAYRFFEAAIDDDTWARNHKEFLDQFVKWVTHLYYSDELDLDFSRKLYKIFTKHAFQVEPFLNKDIVVKVGESSFKANSLIAGHSSDFLRDQIRKAAETNQRTIYLPANHIRLSEFLFDSNKDLTGLNYEKLLEIAKSAQELGMDDLSDESQRLAARFLNENNGLDILTESHNLRLYSLKKRAAEFYSLLNRGFALESGGRDLTVIFNDLKILTTLEIYKSIAPIVSGIGLRHDLGRDPELATIIRLNPKINKLDLSFTTVPPSWDLIPSKIESLLLNRAEWLNSATLEELAARFKGLRHLELEDINYLNYQAYAAIAGFSNLEVLNLKGMRLTDADFTLILSGLRGVKNLNLSGLKKLSSRTIENMVKTLDINRIDLSYTLADDALVADIINRQRRLEEINIRSSAVTTGFIHDLQKKTKARIIIN